MSQTRFLARLFRFVLVLLELRPVRPSLKPSLIFMFLLLPSLYHTPIPADAFSHSLFIADALVLIFVNSPDGSIASAIFGSSLRGWNGSFFLDLCPSTFPVFLYCLEYCVLISCMGCRAPF